MPNFIKIKETFCGQTDVSTDERTNEHLSPALLGRHCRRVDLKMSLFRYKKTPINHLVPVSQVAEPSPQTAGCYQGRPDEPTPHSAAGSQPRSVLLQPFAAGQPPAPVSAELLSRHVGPSSSCAQTYCTLLLQSFLPHSLVLTRLLRCCSIRTCSYLLPTDNLVSQDCYRVKVLHQTRHKIGHFGDVLPSQSLGLAPNLRHQKQTCIHNKLYYNTK